MHRIRQSDREFFNRKLGIRYMEDKQVDHDWENGCTCRILSRKDHFWMGIERGEWNRKGRMNDLELLTRLKNIKTSSIIL